MPIWLAWTIGSSAVAAAGTGAYVLSDKAGDAVVILGIAYLLITLANK